MEEQPNPYQSLTQDQCTAELDKLNELYWNAASYMGNIVASRAILMNQMQENLGD